MNFLKDFRAENHLKVFYLSIVQNPKLMLNPIFDNNILDSTVGQDKKSRISDAFYKQKALKFVLVNEPPTPHDSLGNDSTHETTSISAPELISVPPTDKTDPTQKPGNSAAIFLQFCKERNFVGFSFPEIAVTAAGKKKPIGVPEWKNITRKNYHNYVKKHHTAFAIITGSLSGVTVIDCDSVASFDAITRDHPELLNTLVVRTAKGFHIYCTYEQGIVSNTNSFSDYPNVDIRNDGGILFCPPSKYTLQTKLVEYSIIRKPSGDHSASFVAFPTALKENLKKQVRAESAIQQPLAIVVAQKSGVSSVVASKATLKTMLPDSRNSTDLPSFQAAFGELSELLEALPNCYFEDYCQWFRVGAIIFHELGDSLSSRELFLMASKRSPKHSQNVSLADIDKAWKSYGQPCVVKATKSSLYQACKRHDAKKFEEIQAKFRVFDFSRQNTTQYAKFFLQIYGDDFIQTSASEPVLHFWNSKTLIWQAGVFARDRMMEMIANDLCNDLENLLKKHFKPESKEFEKTLKRLLQLQNRPFKENVMKDILTSMGKQTIEFDVNKEQIDNLHFQNGVLMLDKVTCVNGIPSTENAFRPRKRSDYVTQILPYNFSTAKKEHISEVETIFQEIQPDKTERDFQLSWNAYCTTGHTNQQAFKLNVGYSAANGKSTEAKIHQATFPIYTMKMHKTTFNESNQKQHKQFIHLIRNPIRYAYIEELDRKRLDAESLKDFVDGDKLNVEIMYETSETKAIQAKFIGNSNHDSNLKACKGILRRALLQYYLSQFKEDPDPTKPNQFKMVKGREALFQQDDYKRAYVWVLLPYIAQYYSVGVLIPPSARSRFNDVAEEYDEFKNALLDVCDQGLETDRIFKDDLVRVIQEKLGKHFTFNHILPELKRLGFRFDKGLRVQSISGSQSNRGAVLGLKWNTEFLRTRRYADVAAPSIL